MCIRDRDIITDQDEGGMGVAALSLEDVPPRCVNCDVYRWKQVKDSKIFFIVFLHFFIVQFANCMYVLGEID